MEQIARICIDCKKVFFIEYDTDAICDECSQKLVGKYTKISRKELESRDWNNKTLHKQWQDTANNEMQKLLSKCKGTNYYN